MKNKYSVGRKEDNNIQVKNSYVSGYHAELERISPNVFLLRDLDSTGGTYVNGRRVLRTLITRDKKINLAGVHDLDISMLFEISKKLEAEKQKKRSAQEEKERIRKEFLELEAVYESWKMCKRDLRRKGMIKKTGIRAGLLLIPFVGAALGAAASSSVNLEDKLMAIDEEFEVNYICPKCKNFLGRVSWKVHYNRGKCNFCKTEWLKE